MLVPAGLEKSTGIISTAYLKDQAEPAWKDDKGMNDWRAFMAKYYPDGNVKDSGNVSGYGNAQTLVQVLKQCGDNLTRENVMKQAANLKNFEVTVLLPGIKINTSPTDFAPIQSVQLARFDGKEWARFGEILGK